jgi:hypothetical protein
MGWSLVSEDSVVLSDMQGPRDMSSKRDNPGRIVQRAANGMQVSGKQVTTSRLGRATVSVLADRAAASSASLFTPSLACAPSHPYTLLPGLQPPAILRRLSILRLSA